LLLFNSSKGVEVAILVAGVLTLVTDIAVVVTFAAVVAVVMVVCVNF